MWKVNEGFKESLLIIQDIIFNVLNEMYSKGATVSSRWTSPANQDSMKDSSDMQVNHAVCSGICTCQLSHCWSVILRYLTVLSVGRYYTTRSLCAVSLIRLNGNTGIHLNSLTYKSASEHKIFRDKGPWRITKWYLSFGFLILKSA